MAIRKVSLDSVKNLTFKKAIMGAAIVGLVAAPSIVAAESSTTTTTGTSGSTGTSTTTGTDNSTSPLPGSSSGTASGSTNTTTNGTSTTTGTSGTTNVTGTVQTPTGSTVPTDDDTTVTPNVTFEQAVTNAQAVFPSKTIIRASLTEVNEAPAFVVRFSDGSWVVINSNDGTVTSSFDASTQAKTDTDGDDDNLVLPPQAGIHEDMKADHKLSNGRGSQGEERSHFGV
jgi:hypothetical protein